MATIVTIKSKFEIDIFKNDNFIVFFRFGPTDLFQVDHTPQNFYAVGTSIFMFSHRRRVRQLPIVPYQVPQNALRG